MEDGSYVQSAASPNTTPDTNNQDNDADSEDEDVQDPLGADAIDSDKSEHDNAAIKASVERAFSDFERDYGIRIAAGDRLMAQQIIPKVCHCPCALPLA